jgi:bifunctional non-homologous end joining protein LigD
MPRTKLPSFKRKNLPPAATRNLHPSKTKRATPVFPRDGVKVKVKGKGTVKGKVAGPDPGARTVKGKAEAASRRFLVPREGDVEVSAGGRTVRLTNLSKLFWPELGITKADLLQYYADVSDVLLPHLADRAMVMKRYPHGASGEFFFMKRAPSPRPDWIELCSIQHASGNVIDFPMVQDIASLLWVINLGCIDLNQWYARCDDVDRPDYLHFDLDPVPGAGIEQVLATALLVHESLESLGMGSYAKTTGSKGIHVYVPIVRGPTQKQVWTFAKEFARAMEARDPALVTAEYKIAKRPKGRVLVDYNQNAWGRTLASIYSVRPKDRASVSTPVTWEEVRKGVRIEDFRIDNVPARIAKVGDLWKPLLDSRGRYRLEKFL